MKVSITGSVNKYYVQMLCMIFFPGEHFGESEEQNENAPSLYVKTVQTETGILAYAEISRDGNTSKAEYLTEFTDIRTEERTLKLAVGGAVLNAAATLTGYRPAWGMLIGVRPSKVASEMLNAGMSKTRVKKILNTDYMVIPKKAALATDIAVTEKRIVGEGSKKDCSVYISIPFCPTRCSYCSFVSYTSPKLLAMIPDYLEVLKADVRHTLDVIRSLGLRLASVYIGGGTPTVLNEEQLEDLLEALGDVPFGVDEFTLEAGRPDTITEGKLASAKRHGVTRVSVNTQTLNEEVLRNIGRSPSTDDYFKAYDIAEKMSFRDINVDLIAGLPGDTFESFKDSLDRITALDPTNITVHTFSVKKSAEMKTEGLDVYDRDGDIAARSVSYSGKKLLGCEYIPYYMYRQKNTVGNLENVGYSKKDHEGLYNIFMMDEIHSVFACGASSVTKLVGENTSGEVIINRLFEPKYPYEYLRSDEDARNAKREALYRTAREFYDTFGIK